jgi:outer membrane receptor protein involved in Fe transport
VRRRGGPRQRLLNAGNAAPDTRGQFTVKEAYGEINVPVLAGQPFAHQLNVRAAGRLSDYSTIGSAETWSLGADYAPIEAIRFRGTYAKSVRAPNIGELFTGPSQTFPPGLTDPCLGVTATSSDPTSVNCRADPGVALNIATNGGVFVQSQADRQGISGFNIGNPNLGPETGKSVTAGVVFAPRNINWLRNFVLSVDYYKIKVTDAIIAPARQTILNQCYDEGNAAFCQFVTRFPVETGAASPGAIQFINSVGINGALLKTSGIDTVLQYRTSLDRFFGGLDMNARVAWTHLFSGYAVEVPGAPKNRFAGEIGTAKDRVNGNLGFNTDKWGVSFQGTYIGKSYEDDQFLEGLTGGPFPRDTIVIPAEFYLDAQVRFTPSRTYEFFLGVDNALDNDAPKILSGTPFNVTGSDTAASTYDVFGRRYYAGARLRF